ncbi:MAG: flagellar biosynthetic protein FliR [Oscillospiraceae bacterium]|nr:flagellar biosynthetic protein FliR [Oscillospiraceae bacterium]
MPVITGDPAVWVTHFLMIVTRMSGMFILSPIFGRTNLPANLKVLMSVAMSFIAVQFYPPPAALPPTLFHFALSMLAELLVGLVIGLITTMFFSVVYTAGQVIDTQIGFGMVQIYDVATNAQVPVAGSLFNVVIMICVLLANGHMLLIRWMFMSFEAIPVGQATLRPEIGAFMLRGFAETFLLALNVAMPMLASAMVAEVALGILVRTTPQMNIFVVGMPLKVILGLLMLAVVTPIFMRYTNVIFDRMYLFIGEVIDLMAPGTG